VSACNATANFAADSDSDGLPDNWNNSILRPFRLHQQSDSDTANNLAEYQSHKSEFSRDLVFRRACFTLDPRCPRLPAGLVHGHQFRAASAAGRTNQNQCQQRRVNDAPFISATSYGANASFQDSVRTTTGPGLENTFSLSAEYSVGDNDGLCL
jgi:hypothetical protein